MNKLDLAIAKAAAEGFTQSEMTTMDNCSQKWYWQYVELLNKTGSFSWALLYGSALHATLEQIYKTKGERWSPEPLKIPEDVTLTLAQEAEKEYYELLVGVQAKRYVQYWKDDFAMLQVKHIEEVLDIEFEGIRLKGMIDMIVQMPSGKLWIFDHKTTSRLDPNTVMGWDYRFQFMFYLWLAMKKWPDLEFCGFTINAIKKPALRQGKTESTATFLSRIEMDMVSEPDKYFYRDNLPLTKEAMLHFETFILKPKLNRIRLLTSDSTSDIIKEVLVHNPNTDACLHYNKPCAFLPLCRRGWDLEGFQYEARETKHTELADEATVE